MQLLALLMESGREWTTVELASQLEAPAASLHRELHRLLASGVLERRAVGRTQLYRVSTESPLYEPLHELITRTVGVEEELRRVLDADGIELALIHGSWAAQSVTPRSDVDVLVVGNFDYRDVRRRVHQAGQRLGRGIDLVAFGREEFRERLAEGNSFVRKALAGPNIVLVGDPEAIEVPA